jgi:hypothetical protein
MMPKKQNTNNNKMQKGEYQQGSGSEYHEEHASQVPDYGGNIVDPNASGLSNVEDNNN